MKKMQFFYDYECPYCKRGYESLLKQIGNYPDIEVEWIPIESHPLPEDHSPHTNLAGQAFYAACELGADIGAFNAAMYQAVAIERQNVEDPDVICNILDNIVDIKKLCAIILSGKYAAKIDENNDLAYEKSGVWFVPALRVNGKKLDAKGGVGITSDELENFLKTV